jgi:hypothetical protein
MAKILKNTAQNKKWNNFCGLAAFFLTFWVSAAGQQTGLPPRKLTFTQSALPVFTPSLTPSQTILLSKQPIRLNLGSPFAHWGFMCLGEYKLEKKTGIPFRFRLGSLEYVNRLEGKR